MAARERFTTTLDSELLQEIKILAIRKKQSTNDLLEEAIADLLAKNKDEALKKEKATVESSYQATLLHETEEEYKK